MTTPRETKAERAVRVATAHLLKLAMWSAKIGPCDDETARSIAYRYVGEMRVKVEKMRDARRALATERRAARKAGR